MPRNITSKKAMVHISGKVFSMLKWYHVMLFSSKNLSKYYGSHLALDNITVNVKEGAIGLLGPNGAGKSTLLRILLGLLEPSSGQYQLLGGTESGNTDFVGYMPEHDCLPPKISAVGFVSYFGQLSGLPSDIAMERTHQTLDYVGLAEERYREIDSYSTGMKQRLKLAQALVHDPDVLFLDEPTNGMDPQGREEMLDLLKDLVSMGKSIVLSSHILFDVELVCEEVIILNNGVIIEQEKVEKLLGAGSLRLKINGDVELFIKNLKDRGHHAFKVHGEIHIDDKIASHEIWDVALQSDVQIRYMGFRSKSLEDLFLDLMEGKNGN